MNDTFYHIGFVYIAYLLQNIYKSCKPVKPEDVINLEGKSIFELMSLKDKLIEKSSKADVDKYHIGKIVSLLFFIWLIVGYKSNTPEKNLFLFYAIFIVVIWGAFAALIVWTVINSVFGNKATEYNIEKKKPKFNINISIICDSMGVFTVGYILFSHFLM